MNPAFLSHLPALLITAAVLDIVPRRPRRGLYFGVTTGAAFAHSQEGQAIAWRYRVMVWVGSIAAALVTPYASGAVAAPVQVGIGLLAWLYARSRVLPHAVEPGRVRVARLAQEPGGGLWAAPALVGAVLLLACAAAALYLNYDSLPLRYPAHYGISGEADAFREKTAGRVAMPLVVGALVVALLALNVYGIAYGTRRGGSPETIATREAQRVYFARMLACLALALSAFISFLAVTPVWNAQRIPGGPWMMPAFVVVLIGAVMWAVLRWHEQASGPGDDTPDECWAGGMFYWNADDPVWMVERRHGVGYTLNFAHPFAWAQIALVAALVAVPLLLHSRG